MGITISGLPAATLPLTGAELIVCVQGGVTVQATAADIATGAGGYPHWVTPSPGNLSWTSTTNPGFLFSFDDAAFFQLAMATGSLISCSAIGGPIFYAEGWTPLLCTVAISNAAKWTLTLASGGHVDYDDATNALAEGGFTFTTHQYATPTPAFWGGPGNPASLEAAIDRIAAVVSAGGATPIP